MKLLVLYYSTYGHVQTLAHAVAEGARGVEGAEVTVKRVPELVPEEIAANSGFKTQQDAPLADPNELADYDAIIFGTPTRFGNMASQMRNFLDQTGGLWAKGALIGAADDPYQALVAHRLQRPCHHLVVELDHGMTVRLLVAGVGQGIEGFG